LTYLVKIKPSGIDNYTIAELSNHLVAW